MKNIITETIILFIVFSLIQTGCSSITYETIFPTLGDGKYDSEFPYKSTSIELGEISETVYRVNTTAFYRVYIFNQNDNITKSDFDSESIKLLAVKEFIVDNSASGTAFTVYSHSGKIALITCAHTISFPDTLVTYKLDDSGNQTKFVESYAIKEKQVIYIPGFPDDGQVDLILQDIHMDIALIGKKYESIKSTLLPFFHYPFGKAKEVEWGTFVYLVGYPINFKIITKAIVSSPRRDASGSFLVDAVVNPGFSGGLVLAIRDGVPNFELIGMVQWVPEEEENLLYPENLKTKLSYNPVIPYQGNLYVRKHSSIRYGIAKIIPVENILTFLIQNKEYLNEKGFYIFQN